MMDLRTIGARFKRTIVFLRKSRKCSAARPDATITVTSGIVAKTDLVIVKAIRESLPFNGSVADIHLLSYNVYQKNKQVQLNINEGLMPKPPGLEILLNILHHPLQFESIKSYDQFKVIC
jgi:hypothetical protein